MSDAATVPTKTAGGAAPKSFETEVTSTAVVPAQPSSSNGASVGPSSVPNPKKRDASALSESSGEISKSGVASVPSAPTTNFQKTTENSTEATKTGVSGDTVSAVQAKPTPPATAATRPLSAPSAAPKVTVSKASGTIAPKTSAAITKPAVTVPAAKPQPAPTPAPQPQPKLLPVSTQLLLPDYSSVSKTLTDLLALLQTYGPLTAGQLEYNLPPVQSKVWGVKDVLAVCSTIGLIQQVEGTQQYCMHQGIPRSDVVLPSDLPEALVTAQREAEASWKRSRALKECLMKQTSPKEILKKMLLEYPDIINDPVYLTALRNFHIDTHSKSKTTTSGRKNSSSATKGGASKGSKSTSAQKSATWTAGESSSTSAIVDTSKATATLPSTKGSTATTSKKDATATNVTKAAAGAVLPTPPSNTKPATASAAPTKVITATIPKPKPAATATQKPSSTVVSAAAPVKELQPPKLAAAVAANTSTTTRGAGIANAASKSPAVRSIPAAVSKEAPTHASTTKAAAPTTAPTATAAATALPAIPKAEATPAIVPAPDPTADILKTTETKK